MNIISNFIKLNFSSTLKACSLYFMMALILTYLMPYQGYADQIDLLDNIQYGLDGLSFPDDIEIEPIADQPGQFRIYDPNLTFARVQEITVAESDLPGIEATIELARYHRTMLVLENDVKNTVQMAVLRAYPEQIEFKIIDTNPGFFGSFVQSNTGFIEIWYRQSDQTDPVFVGTTCRGCSSKDLAELGAELERVRQREIDLDHGLVEINISFSGTDVLYAGTRSRYRPYKANEIALLPVFESSSGEFLGLRLLKIKKPFEVAQDKLSELNFTEQRLNLNHTVEETRESPFVQRGMVFLNPRFNSENEIIFDTFNLMEWEENLANEEDPGSYIGEIVSIVGSSANEFLNEMGIPNDVRRTLQAQQIFYSFGKVLSEAQSTNSEVIANWQRARIPQLFLKIPGPDDPHYEPNLPTEVSDEARPF